MRVSWWPVHLQHPGWDDSQSSNPKTITFGPWKKKAVTNRKCIKSFPTFDFQAVFCAVFVFAVQVSTRKNTTDSPCCQKDTSSRALWCFWLPWSLRWIFWMSRQDKSSKKSSGKRCDRMASRKSPWSLRRVCVEDDPWGNSNPEGSNFLYTQTDSEVILSTNQTKINTYIDKIRVKLASKLAVYTFQHQLWSTKKHVRFLLTSSLSDRV